MTGRICVKETPARTTQAKVFSNHAIHCYLCHYYVIVFKIRSNTEFWIPIIYLYRGTRWRSWLRYRATSQKVAVSIHDGVIGIFH
jgi:hypothetical protein